MASLLIIGGSGFFGKSILDSYKRKLLKPWNIDKIIIMSRNPHQLSKDYPELISDGVEFFAGDVSTVNYLPYADFIIHAAASTDASRYLLNDQDEEENIILGTLNYCRLAEEFHKKSRIIFCSSGAVYGYQPESIKFLKESSLLGDVSKLDSVKRSYAYAKRDSEAAIQRLGQKNINVAIARCFSFVGRYLPRNQHFAIGNFIKNGANGSEIKVKAENLVYRSYMYADDLVDWLLTIADNSSSKCPIYNVGSDKEVEIRDLASLTSQIYNVNVKTVEINNNAILDRYVPSLEKAKKELGLISNYGLKESILMSIEGH